jgi:hypothetical protein
LLKLSREKGGTAVVSGGVPSSDCKKVLSCEVVLKPPDRCAKEGVGILLRPSISGGGGERVVAESSGKMRVEDPQLGFQYCDASLGSIPLLSSESRPDCCCPNSMSGDGTEPVPEPDAGTSNAAVAGSSGEDPIPVTVGT